MRVSRAPEYRGGTGSPILLILVLLVVLIVGGVVIYLLLENNPAAAPVVPPAQVTTPGNPEPFPTVPQRSNPAPQVQPTQPPVSPQETNMSMGGDTLRFQPPEVIFGEVLAEGFVDLELLNGRVRTWFTFQVDTSTQNIVLFFGFFDQEGKTMSRTVSVENYSQSEIIDNAEMTVFYPGAPDRVINFDREAGTITSRQFYTTQPYGPSLFSPQTRISMINQGLVLQNVEGDIQAELQVDLTGVSDREGFVLLENNPVATEDALDEIQAVIDQLESRRDR